MTTDEHDVNYEKNEGKPTVLQILKEEIFELRWRVLIAACFLTFGCYYIFDTPGALGNGDGNTIQQHFKQHGKEFTQAMNQMLYSVYSWPNTVLAIFGGLLIDKYLGLRVAMLLFTSLILLGAILFWVGVHFIAYPLMITARVIFGLGGESLTVAQSAYLARWFKGNRGLALAFGIRITFSRLGSSFNFYFSPRIAEANNLNVALLVGVIACLISLIACVILVVVDKYAVRIEYIKPEPHEEGGAAVMRLSDALRMPFAFWALTAICVFCYCAIFPFVGVGKNFFEVKYGYSPTEASSYISAYQITSAVGAPVVGFIVDIVGRNTLWLLTACACFVLVHLLFIVTMIPGIAMMIMFGIFYSFLASSLWPTVPWAVNENIVGFSYGVMTAIQNIGLAVFPIIVGKILDKYMPQQQSKGNNTNASNAKNSSSLPSLQGYKMVELLLIGSATIALIASIVLLVYDLRHGGILTASSSRRKLLQAERSNKPSQPLPEEEIAPPPINCDQ